MPDASIKDLSILQAYNMSLRRVAEELLNSLDDLYCSINGECDLQSTGNYSQLQSQVGRIVDKDNKLKQYIEELRENMCTQDMELIDTDANTRNQQASQYISDAERLENEIKDITNRKQLLLERTKLFKNKLNEGLDRCKHFTSLSKDELEKYIDAR